MLQDSLREHAVEGDFLGQMTVSDFLVITRMDSAAPLKDRIQKRLTQSFDYFYPNQGRSGEGQSPKRLGVKVCEMTYAQTRAREPRQLKMELERLYRPVKN